MTGSIYKKSGKNTYTVSWLTNEYVNGQRRRKTKSGFTSKSSAEKFLRKMLDEVDEGFQRENSNIALSKYLINWLNTYSCSTGMAENTINGYRVNIENHILPCIGHIKLDCLSPDDIDLLIVNMSNKGLSRTSQRYVLATLRKALNTAVKRRIISFNPISCVDLPKPSKFHSNVLNTEQLQVLFSACLEDFEYLPILLIITFGLRRGEALGLKWSDIDFKYKTIFIQRTATPAKGGYKFSPCKSQESIRKLILPDFLVSYLLTWKEKQKPCSDDEFIFTNSNGKLIPAMRINRNLSRLLAKYELPIIRVHDLRHSWATMMLSKEIHPKIVSSMLGYSDISITMNLYSHMLTDMQKPAVNVLNTVFGC